jgi:hypothetical protein
MKTTPPGNRYRKETSEIQRSINDYIISDLKPRIKEFLLNPHLPNWVPPESVNDEIREFYNDQAIPLFNGKPSLLLHKLGNTPHPNVSKVFDPENHK